MPKRRRVRYSYGTFQERPSGVQGKRNRFSKKSDPMQWLFRGLAVIGALAVVALMIKGLAGMFDGPETSITVDSVHVKADPVDPEINEITRKLDEEITKPLEIDYGEQEITENEDTTIISRIDVEVRNGTRTPRIAAKVANSLDKSVYTVVKTDNVHPREFGDQNRNTFPKSLVIDRMGNMKPAYRLAAELGLDSSAVLSVVDPLLVVDLTVVLGKDYRSLTPFKNKEQD